MTDHPIIEDPARWYRLWHWKDKKYLPYTNYTNAWRAVVGAWVWQKRYGKTGDVVEVIDVRTAKLIGQYKRTPTSVIFLNENHRLIQAGLDEIINRRIHRERHHA